MKAQPKPKRKLVMAAHAWPTNAALIRDVAKLGYLNGHVLDPTHGYGKWWDLWRPNQLTAHDIDPAKAPDGPADFTALPYDDATFDSVAFDPAYMAPGGRRTSTIHNFNDRFGLHSTPAKPTENQEKINAGVTEMYRILKRRGFLLVKCMDYVNGGALFPGTYYTMHHALSVGFRFQDRFEHVGTPGPQSQKSQEHARRNLSTLLVFKKPHNG